MDSECDTSENSSSEACATSTTSKYLDGLLHPKSKDKYESTYITFMNWKKEKDIKSFETALLTYFDEISEKLKPPTLWAYYSMLKSTLKIKNNVDIQQYKKLLSFLKRRSEGYQSTKANILSSNEVEKFLNEAPDKTYLATKVALIFGIAGACRKNELCQMTVDNIKTHGQILLVKVPNSKTSIPRSFTIDGDFYNIVKKYQELRPPNVMHNRFFLNYQHGKCTVQVIGKNKFSVMPKQIAQYLKLPNPNSYTGHTFRRTSATLLAESGADLQTLKRHGGWRCAGKPADRDEDTISYKQQTGSLITESIILRPAKNVRPVEPSSPEMKEGNNEHNHITVDNASMDFTEDDAMDSDASDFDDPLRLTDPQDFLEVTTEKEDDDDDDDDDDGDDGDSQPRTSTNNITCEDDQINAAKMQAVESVISNKISIPGQNITIQFSGCTNVHFHFSK